MTLHALKQYLLYKRTAKSRHGVHSPYVYDLVEKAFRNKTFNYTALREAFALLNKEPFPQQYKDLVARIIFYNQSKLYAVAGIKGSLEHYSLNDTGRRLDKIDVLWLNATAPDNWQQTIDKYMHLCYPNTIIIVSDIHKTSVHTKAWEKLYNNLQVKLSIDINRLGLLFFREEFKEQQHFVLKY